MIQQAITLQSGGAADLKPSPVCLDCAQYRALGGPKKKKNKDLLKDKCSNSELGRQKLDSFNNMLNQWVSIVIREGKKVE